MSGLEILAAVSTAASLGSQAVAGGSAYAAAQANEKIAEANKRQALSDAGIEEGRIRRSNERQLADARVALGSRGVSGGGSISDVLADMAAERELEARMPRTEGERQARYYDNVKRQAKQQGAAALWGTGLKMATTLATDGYDAWDRGAFGGKG